MKTKPKILVVDDDPALRDALAYIFAKKDRFEVFTAADGEEGYETAIREDVDIVLSDIRMPRADGVQLLDRLKARHVSRPVVVLITGYADINLEDAYHKGADALLQKPFDRAMLEEVVMRAITPAEERWAMNPKEIEAALRIELRFSEFGKAVMAKLVNIGRGGILVSLPDKLPSISQNVYFNIEFSGEIKLLIQGAGVVRWVRLRDGVESPRGCGIEFVSLSEESRKQVLELIQTLGVKSFIPKT